MAVIAVAEKYSEKESYKKLQRKEGLRNIPKKEKNPVCINNNFGG